MSTISILYTSQHAPFTDHSVEFKFFGGSEISRVYSGQSSVGSSANGTNIISGPAYRQKYIWGIGSISTKAEALALDALFRDWDEDRSAGLAAVVGVVDSTFGSTVSTSAVFSTPPTFSRLSPATYSIDFGVSEV